jgi:apolipoprotein N-acyltransferase
MALNWYVLIMAASYRRIAAAALASGVMLWAASPAVGFGWLAWIALVPVAYAVLAMPRTRPGRLAVPLAYVVYLELLLIPAFPFGLTEGQWGDPVIPVLIGESPLLAIALVAVPLVGALLYGVRFGEPWGAMRLPGSLSMAALIAVPALAWTALDFARAKVDPGGLWGPLFLSQADTPAGSLAALGGPWLITLAIVSVNYGIAATSVRRRARFALAPIGAVAILVVAASAVERGISGGEPLRVGALQPGYDTAEDRPELRFFRRGTYDLAALDLIEDLGELTREAVDEGAQLIVWPEATMYIDPRTEPAVRSGLRRLVRETGASLVVPFFRPQPIAESHVVAIEPSQAGTRFTAARPKHRPLWFLGEEPGSGEPGSIEVGRLEIGPLLGVDTQDARNAAELVAEGAEILVSSTHDWQQSAIPARAHARLAARAAGAPLVRADWRYGSAAYESDGTALADAGEERERTSLIATVELADRATLYGRIGDVIGWLAVGAVGLAALAALASMLGPGGPLSRAGGPTGGGRAPARVSTPRRPSRERPPAGAGRRQPPP